MSSATGWMLRVLLAGDATPSFVFKSTADASRLTRRPCVITCRRRSKMLRAARVLTFPLSAHHAKKHALRTAGREELPIGRFKADWWHFGSC